MVNRLRSTSFALLTMAAGVAILGRSLSAGEAPAEPAGQAGIKDAKPAQEAPYLQFLGTKAGTEYLEYAPSEARSIFGYAMLYVPPNAVVDFAQDAREKMRHWGVTEESIDKILITHAHPDHLHVPTLMAFARERWHAVKRATHVYASETAYRSITKETVESDADAFLTVTRIAAGDRIELAENVSALVIPSTHWTARTPVHFLFQFHGKEILYAVDAALGKDDYFAHFAGHQLDVVIIDCTYLEREVDPTGSGHMNYAMVCGEMEKLRGCGATTAETPCYITHLVPVSHESAAAAAAKHGLLVAYDGLRLTFP